MNSNDKKEILKQIKKSSSGFNPRCKELAVILAAGHGKRIKSQRSKMLHTIWGVPTVERVHTACSKAVKEINSVVVIGIKALDVLNVLGKKQTLRTLPGKAARNWTRCSGCAEEYQKLSRRWIRLCASR